MPAHIIQCAAILFSLCFMALGCATQPSVDVLFADANSHLADAQKAGAEQYANSAFSEAKILLNEAESAIQNKDKRARTITQNAMAKARLAKVLALQLEAESKTTQLEAELEIAFSESAQASEERQSAQIELGKMSSSD